MSNKKIKVELKGKKYELKAWSYRAAFLFESLSEGKSISEMSTFEDRVKWLYCLLTGLNKDFLYEFDEFVDILEESPELMAELQEAISEKK